MLFGKHWRDLWTTPVKVPVLDLDNYSGGLNVLPSDNSGGKQSKVLKFSSKDGKIFKFRSTLKFAKFAIDPELKGTIAEYIVQDQVSIKHPYAPVIAFRLLKSAGVLMPEPMMYVLPHDRKFDANRDFNGLLGTLQEIPVKKKPYLGFEEVIKTTNLLKKIDKEPGNRVDAVEFLKARLMDIFISDWDRHHKQWLWAGSGDENNILWKPVSQDRDEAFCRYDGLIPWLFAEAVPRFEGISENYPNVEFLTWEGRYLDRKFLPSVTKHQWDSVTASLKNTLTDSVIHYAVSKLPGEWYRLSGKELEHILKARRNGLKEVSEEYYYLISREPEIWATDKNEIAEISTNEENKLELKIFESGNTLPYFSRVFDECETGEIRLYLQGGIDTLVLKGSFASDIKLKVINGSGDKTLIERTDKYAVDIDVTFFTNGKQVHVNETGNVSVNTDNAVIPKDALKKIDRRPQDFGGLLTFIPSFNFNSDEGFIFGGTSVYNRYGFRYDPYKYRLSANAVYATRTRGYSLEINTHFAGLIKNVLTGFSGKLSGSQFSKFYGMGNSSTLDKELNKSDFYKVESHHLGLAQLFSFKLGSSITLKTGIELKSIYTENKPYTIIDNKTIKGTGRVSFASVYSGITYSSALQKTVPLPKTSVGIFVSYSKGVLGSRFDLTKTGIEISQSLLENVLPRSFLTISLKAEKVFGNFPFYESAMLGGGEYLRGYALNRFSGDALVAAKADLDIYLFNTMIFLPADISLLLLSDAGRVFLNGETNSKLHYSIGGGFNLGYFRRMFNMKIYGAGSEEGAKFYISALFSF